MRKLFIVLMAIFSGEMAFAASCPKCNGPLLATDAFCAGCGLDILEWRRRQSSPRPQSSGQSNQGGLYNRYDSYKQNEDSYTLFKIGFGGVASLPSMSNANVYGMSIEGGSIGDTLCGLGLGCFGEFKNVFGVQCGVMGNLNMGNVNSVEALVYGLQIGGIFNVDGTVYGLQVACMLNGAWNNMYGIQIAGLGNSAGCMHGIQIGFFNGDKNVNMEGIQIGIINVAREMSGIQIGAINYINCSPISFLPAINMYF